MTCNIGIFRLEARKRETAIGYYLVRDGLKPFEIDNDECMIILKMKECL